jgi:anti-sigma-K factor RskA
VNDFNELIDAGVAGEERQRLLGVHELVVKAGPPPELPEGLEHGYAPSELRRLKFRYQPRRVALLAAAVLVLGVTFTAGLATGIGRSSSTATVRQLSLKGTAAAPHAQATLDVQKAVGGNWPMTLQVSGLPRVAAPTYYEVWLVRHGQPLAPCGEFVVSKSSSSLTLPLNAPYKLQRGDTWIVTRHTYGQSGPGSTVLRPI